MPIKIFGRIVEEAHPLNVALHGLEGDAQPPWKRAQASNLRHDHRISEEREQTIVSFCGARLTADSFLQILYTYFEDQIRTAQEPDFLKSANGHNAIYGGGEPSSVSGDTFLVRLLNLNGMNKLFAWARQRQWPEDLANKPFEDFPEDAPAISPEVERWLDDHMSEPRRTWFVALVIRLLNDRMAMNAPFHPAWVSVWDHFSDFLRQNGSQNWLELFGLGSWTAFPNQWWIGLCYSARRALTLFHPTVLESGLNAYYFPSPPGAPAGHCMHLKAKGEALVWEFVHQQVELSVDDWAAAYHLTGRTRLSEYPELPDQRSSHYSLLDHEYYRIEEWMKHP